MNNSNVPIFSEDFCKKWQGVSLVCDKLIEERLFVAKIFQESIVDYYQFYGGINNIHDYWLEVAREYISSGGHGSGGLDRGRFRNTKGFYNSKLLSHLEACMILECPNIKNENPRFLPAVHPVIRRFNREWQYESEIRKITMSRIRQTIDLEKDIRNECFKDMISLETKKKFYLLAEVFGFKWIKVDKEKNMGLTKVLSYNINSELIFYTYIEKYTESNLRQRGYFNAPFAISLNEVDERTAVQLGDMSLIAPGISYYKNNIDPDGFLLAFSAHFACAVAIANTFRNYGNCLDGAATGELQ